MKTTIFHSTTFYSFNNTVGKVIQNDPLLKEINSRFWYTSRKKWIPVGLIIYNVSVLFYDTISVTNRPKNQKILRGVL